MRLGSQSSYRYALAGVLLADTCSKAHPIFTKILYIHNWTPLSIYFITLFFVAIFLGLHEFMQMDGKHRWNIGRKDIMGIVLTTLTGGVLSPLLLMIGLQHVQASEAVLINGIIPLFIVVLAVLMLREHFTKQMILGGLFLLSGTFVLFWNDIWNAELNSGMLIIILAAFFGALTTILHKKYVQHRHLDSIILIRTIISLVIVGFLMLLWEPESFVLLLNPPDIWTILGLTVIAFILPYFLYFRSIVHVKTMDVGIVLTAGPGIGLLLSNVFLGEEIRTIHLISMALVAAGIFFINVPLTKWRIVPSRLMAQGPLRR